MNVVICLIILVGFFLLGCNQTHTPIENPKLQIVDSIECDGFPAPHPTTQTKIEREMTIKELLVRYMIERRSQAEVFFISYDEDNSKVTPPEFIDRFSDLKVKIKDASLSTGKDPKGSVFDKDTGKSAYILYPRIIHWIDEKSVKAEYKGYMHSLAAYGATVMLQYKEGKWWIVDQDNMWVS